MPHDGFGQPRAEHPDAVMSRRRLITLAALVAGVGVTDAACGGARRDLAASQVVRAGGGAAPPAHPGPTTHRTVDPRPARHPHGGHAHETEHRSGGRHHRRPHRQVDNVTLPPATVPVHPRPAYRLGDLLHSPPRDAIGLTIDDGPDPVWTPKVLRLLDRLGVRATFCVVGIHAEAYPRLVRDITRAGHAVVNHSYTHVQPFNRQTERRIVEEITRTQHVIERASKVTPQLFRAPGGDWSPFVLRAIASYGLQPVDWDVDPLDWSRPGTKRIRRAMLRARPGDIVLCHDGGGNRAETVRALRRVLPAWHRRHYTVVPLRLPAGRPRPAPSPTATRPHPTGTPAASPTPSPSPTAP